MENTEHDNKMDWLTVGSHCLSAAYKLLKPNTLIDRDSAAAVRTLVETAILIEGVLEREDAL